MHVSKHFKSFLFSTLLVSLLISKAKAQTFIKVPGNAIDVAINPSNGVVYAVGTPTNEVFSYDAQSNKLVKYLTGANASRIAVGSDNTLWIVRKNKKVARAQNGSWQDVSPFTYSNDITVDTQGFLYSLFATNGKVLRYVDNTWNFRKEHGARISRIAAKNRSNFWAIAQDNSIKKFFKNTYTNMPGNATDISRDAVTGRIYIVGLSKSISVWENSSKKWIPLLNSRKDVVNIAVHDNNIWCTTTNNSVYKMKVGNEKTTPNFAFNSSRPKVVVLLHGITASKNNSSGRDNGVDTYRHPQFYWGYHFLRSLANVPKNGKMKVIAPPADRKTPFEFGENNWGDHRDGLIYRQGYNTNAHHAYVVRYNSNSPDILCTYRNGSVGLMQQTKAAINQTYEAYQAYYGSLPANEQPMIYLVAHSFGGIVGRTILSNPTQADRNGVLLSALERERADFLRDRTVSLTTLSTPHDGSPLPKVAQENDKNFKVFANDLRKVKLDNLAKGVDDLRNDKIDGEKVCLSDIRYNNFYLNRFLNPKNAVRSDGKLVPIYTLTGSNPGYRYFFHKRAALSPYDISIVDLGGHSDTAQGRGYSKLGMESFLLVFLDMINEYGKPFWPAAPTSNPFADRYTMMKTWTMDDVAVLGINVGMKKDGKVDSDGFVSFNSGHGLWSSNSDIQSTSGKFGGSWYRMFGKDYGMAHPWDIDNHRSICYNPGTAAYIGSYILKRGPNVIRDEWSSWSNRADAPVLKDKIITVDFTYLKNLAGDDFGSDGYRAEVKIGHAGYQNSAAIKEKKVIDSDNFQKGKNYFWHFSKGIPNATLVPVIIKIFNYRANLNDQLCSTSPEPFAEETLFYVDAQNGRVYGDIEGNITHNPFVVNAFKTNKRPIELRFKIKLSDYQAN